jgi:ABC-type nickel/cobalt efflux system permease component RcnA
VSALLSSGQGVTLLLLAATAYGVIHALGPGHQKTLLAGYFLSERATPGRVAKAAFLTAALHAGSSVALVGGIFLLLNRFSTGTFEETRMLIQRGAGLILVGMAGWMLVLRVRLAVHRLREHGDAAGHRHHEEECPVCARAERARREGRSLLGIVLLGGLIPCPGAAMIVLFGMSSGHFGLGAAAVLALSAGMGFTLLAVGLAARFLRIGAEENIRSKRNLDRVRSVFEVGGALLVLLFALALVL